MHAFSRCGCLQYGSEVAQVPRLPGVHRPVVRQAHETAQQSLWLPAVSTLQQRLLIRPCPFAWLRHVFQSIYNCIKQQVPQDILIVMTSVEGADIQVGLAITAVSRIGDVIYRPGTTAVAEHVQSPSISPPSVRTAWSGPAPLSLLKLLVLFLLMSIHFCVF